MDSANGHLDAPDASLPPTVVAALRAAHAAIRDAERAVYRALNHGDLAQLAQANRTLKAAYEQLSHLPETPP